MILSTIRRPPRPDEGPQRKARAVLLLAAFLGVLAVLLTPSADPAGGATTGGSGYWMLGRDGAVYGFGAAGHLGDPPVRGGASDLESLPDGSGYLVLDRTGRVFLNDRPSPLGGLAPGWLAPGEAATSISATPGARGYWVFTSHGRVVPFGAARHLGDMAGVPLNAPVLGSVATPSGHGYYMVSGDGGIFAFGDAGFRGSMGGQPLNAPVESLAPDPDGDGYWLVASDGGIFAFDAPFLGSMGGTKLNRPISGMVGFAGGYLMVGEDGGIFTFGTARFAGSLGDRPPSSPVVAVAPLATATTTPTTAPVVSRSQPPAA